MSEQVINIYTDGSCKGNPGIGGWGVYAEKDGDTHTLEGGADHTTNNKMELAAVIEALKFFDQGKLNIYVDSVYVKNGIQTWIKDWKKNGWRTAARKPVANQEEWQQLDALVEGRDITWHWVKGHSGNHGNEMADQLSNRYYLRKQGLLS